MRGPRERLAAGDERRRCGRAIGMGTTTGFLRRSPVRLGTSLLEVLLAVTIIGVLVGLSLPAVQQVRGAAARATCRNNLRQVGLALHGYHGDFQALPPGQSGRYGPFGIQPTLGWHARMLPYIEREPLWAQTIRAFQQAKTPTDNPPHVGFSTVVDLFVCPADAASREAHDVPFAGLPRAAFTDYLGVAGRDYRRTDGVLFSDSRVHLTDIIDGISNTLAAGERPPSADYVFGWWYAGNGQGGGGSGDMVLGVRELNAIPGYYSPPCPLGPEHFRPGDTTLTCHYLHFWSHHPGGAHFLFCDGSVRFLTYSADAVLPALATRAGGEVIEVP